MSDTSSENQQNNEAAPENPLAKMFFDKLRKDGPKRDRVGQSFVRHFSQPVSDPLRRSTDADAQQQQDLIDDTDDVISPARRFRQERIEIIKLKTELKI